ncbi:MAG: hypothetical protein QXZ36_03640 [Thermoproteota archaeon]
MGRTITPNIVNAASGQYVGEDQVYVSTLKQVVPIVKVQQADGTIVALIKDERFIQVDISALGAHITIDDKRVMQDDE